MASQSQRVSAPGPGRYNYAIVFRQHNDAPKEYKQRWKALIKTINTNPDVVIAGWLQHLQRGIDDVGEEDAWSLDMPPRGSDLVPLKRAEGGIGGDDNRTCRQIRVDQRMKTKVPHGLNYNEIMLTARGSWDGTDVWAPAELCGYRDTFSDVIVDHLGCSAHQKRIEIEFLYFK